MDTFDHQHFVCSSYYYLCVDCCCAKKYPGFLHGKFKLFYYGHRPVVILCRGICTNCIFPPGKPDRSKRSFAKDDLKRNRKTTNTKCTKRNIRKTGNTKNRRVKPIIKRSERNPGTTDPTGKNGVVG